MEDHEAIFSRGNYLVDLALRAVCQVRVRCLPAGLFPQRQNPPVVTLHINSLGPSTRAAQEGEQKSFITAILHMRMQNYLHIFKEGAPAPSLCMS